MPNIRSDHCVCQVPSQEDSSFASVTETDAILAKVATAIGLDKLIILGPSEEKQGGRKRESNIACSLEAILGAYYLSGKFDEIEKFINDYVIVFAEDIDKHFEKYNAKDILQQYTQAQDKTRPEYRTVAVNGPAHKPEFEIEVIWDGKMIAKAKEKKLFFMEAMWTAFNPCIKKIKQIISEGKIGEVKHIESSFYCRFEKNLKSRLWNPELAGGGLLDLGIYNIYYALNINNFEKLEEHSSSVRLENGVDAWNSVNLKFKNGVTTHFQNALDNLLPKSLIPVIIDISGVDPYKKVHSVTKEERLKLLKTLKSFELNITTSRGFDEAIITQGGVSVKEINPKTMECKKVKGLSFIGEVLDVDALTGGFNLQIAWSTARMVGGEGA